MSKILTDKKEKKKAAWHSSSLQRMQENLEYNRALKLQLKNYEDNVIERYLKDRNCSCCGAPLVEAGSSIQNG